MKLSEVFYTSRSKNSISFTNAAGRSLEGGAVPNASTSLTITLTNGTTVDWSAGRIIQAVIIKGGPGANVYPYNPSFGDTALVAPDGHEISHITFCFPTFVPTAAKVSISGRVTDDSGNGLPRSTLTIINTHTSETRTAVSNSFGYFRFDDLEVGNIYMVTVQNKKYSFETETRTFVLNDAMENMDFKASP